LYIYHITIITIDGGMVSVLASSMVDQGFIGGVMVCLLASNVVDRGFIGGVMVSVLASSMIDLDFCFIPTYIVHIPHNYNYC
jgi:hypothetical protein